MLPIAYIWTHVMDSDVYIPHCAAACIPKLRMLVLSGGMVTSPSHGPLHMAVRQNNMNNGVHLPTLDRHFVHNDMRRHRDSV